MILNGRLTLPALVQKLANAILGPYTLFKGRYVLDEETEEKQRKFKKKLKK